MRYLCSCKQLLIAAIAVTAGLTFVGSPLSAQTIWDGSEPDDLWFTADNWNTGVVPNGATAEAVVGVPSPTVSPMATSFSNHSTSPPMAC